MYHTLSKEIQSFCFTPQQRLWSKIERNQCFKYQCGFSHIVEISEFFIQNLRKINFGESRSSKTAEFAILVL